MIIPLTRGYVTQIDPDDYDWITSRPWHVAIRHQYRRGPTHIYAQSKSRHDEREAGFPSYVFLHRAILLMWGVLPDIRSPLLVDHWNCDGLDNRKANLRISDCSQNNANSRLRFDSYSGYKGVAWHKPLGRWSAQIRCGELKHLGYFETPELAAKAYDTAARELWGSFARVNFDQGKVAER